LLDFDFDFLLPLLFLEEGGEVESSGGSAGDALELLDFFDVVVSEDGLVAASDDLEVFDFFAFFESLVELTESE